MSGSNPETPSSPSSSSTPESPSSSSEGSSASSSSSETYRWNQMTQPRRNYEQNLQPSDNKENIHPDYYDSVFPRRSPRNHQTNNPSTSGDYRDQDEDVRRL